uniref:Retrovirus-related Pol polyprotein from transposon TNT 1-94 n=1 Tax=Tanacetum cinerariifolium TaxID=118510 RepID=A0A6L2P7B6_TANCI|nr:retrovirus-related Pol polyprotein from transposon TNT 1-94 [Tanacetum cinerariifolium]
MICHIYYVEGHGYDLFSVGQFCDGDLEVAFRSNTCYVRNLEGEDLLTDSCNSKLYTIFISNKAASSPVYLMSKATSTKSRLWHRRLSYRNFGTINHLTKQDLVDGLLKFKYEKDLFCPAYYFLATPGNTSPDSSNDLTKYLLATLVFSPLHDDSYMEVMQAYDATNELPIPPLEAPIASPIVMPPVLSLFDS